LDLLGTTYTQCTHNVIVCPDAFIVGTVSSGISLKDGCREDADFAGDTGVDMYQYNWLNLADTWA
jgi:hypothetical protein